MPVSNEEECSEGEESIEDSIRRLRLWGELVEHVLFGEWCEGEQRSPEKVDAVGSVLVECPECLPGDDHAFGGGEPYKFKFFQSYFSPLWEGQANAVCVWVPLGVKAQSIQHGSERANKSSE